MSCMTILFINLQISRSDIKPYITWAVSLVILHIVTSIFLWGLCGYIYGLTHSVYHPRGDRGHFVTHLSHNALINLSLVNLVVMFAVCFTLTLECKLFREPPGLTYSLELCSFTHCNHHGLHLETPGNDDQILYIVTLASTRAIIKVSGHQHHWFADVSQVIAL